MIPDLAVIVSAYAVARLLCEYCLEGPTLQPLRIWVALGAIGVVVLFCVSIVSTATSTDFGL